MNRKVIPILAPPAPKCFSSRDQWTTYLMDAQAANKHPPFVNGKYRSTFEFCRDCSAQHALAMDRAGRCCFNEYVANLQGKEPAHASAA